MKDTMKNDNNKPLNRFPKLSGFEVVFSTRNTLTGQPNLFFFRYILYY